VLDVWLKPGNAGCWGLFEDATDLTLIDKLRQATHENLRFGRTRFKEEIELLYGPRIQTEKTGPKVL
jgi:hypothetical protein